MKFFKILFNKDIQAPKLSWTTSWLGSRSNSFYQEIKSLFKANKLGKEFKKAMWNSSQSEID